MKWQDALICRLRRDLQAADVASADAVSAELERTKGKLDNATATGKELGDEVKKLKGQLQHEQLQLQLTTQKGTQNEQEWKAMNQKMIELANSVRTKGMLHDKVSEEEAQRLLKSTPTSVRQELKENVDKVSHEVIQLKRKREQAEKAAAVAAAQLLTVTQALENSHNHVRRLTADAAEPKARMQIMCDFLRTHHNAHITFDQ